MTSIFKDKLHNLSMRELLGLLSFVGIIIAWIGEQFFKYKIPDQVLPTLAAIVGASILGYTFEKPAAAINNEPTLPQNEG
jgi:hypothetical protein